MSYVKVHGSMLDSTVWDLPDHVRLVWITMLAMKDEYGVVSASVPGLARRARVTLENTENAIEILSGPDRYSRTKHDDGRRIEEVDGGWLVLNHDKYREIQSIDYRRAKTAERTRKWRERGSVTRAASHSVTDRHEASQVTLGDACDAIRSDQIKSEQSSQNEEMSPPPGDDRTSAASPDAAGGDSEPGTGETPAGPENVRQSAANALVDAASGSLHEPPMLALTTATLLLDYVLRENPKHELVKCTENQRDKTIAEWARIIHKMHVPNKREYNAMQAVLHWVFRDPSWRRIVVSAEVWREQWHAIVAHKERKKPDGKPLTRRRVLPDAWRPERSPVNMAAEKEARDRGVDVTRELERMRDWARANHETKADWEATWRNWVRGSKPVSGAGGFHKPPSAGAVMMAEVERLEREERERELEHPQQLLLEEGR